MSGMAAGGTFRSGDEWFSADGRWRWDGSKWVPTGWRWDGQKWSLGEASGRRIDNPLVAMMVGGGIGCAAYFLVLMVAVIGVMIAAGMNSLAAIIVVAVIVLVMVCALGAILGALDPHRWLLLALAASWPLGWWVATLIGAVVTKPPAIDAAVPQMYGNVSGGWLGLLAVVGVIVVLVGATAGCAKAAAMLSARAARDCAEIV